MTTDLTMLVWSVILTFIMFFVPNLVRVRGWTPSGLMILLGNRDNLPEPTPLSGRADRAARNMLEAMVLFTPLVLAARVAGVPETETALGAQLFFWARLVYFPVYLIGIPGVRTLIWLVAVVGMVMVLLPLL